MSEHLKLNNQLCFRLYKLNKSVTKLYAPLLKKLSLTYPQYLVMLVLWEEKEPVSIKALCKRLELDTGTLSPLLKRMETLLFINRIKSKQDERVVIIELTRTGKALKKQAELIPSELFCSTRLSIEELVNLQTTLDLLLNNVQQRI